MSFLHLDVLKNNINSFLKEKNKVVEEIHSQAGEKVSLRVIREKTEEALKTINVPLWLEQEEVRRPFQVHTIIGSGGQKKAWRLTDQNVLMLPNYDSEEVQDIAKFWETSVMQEVRVGQFLNQQGLLNCNNQLVKIFLDNHSSEFIPAYISDSFDELKKKNIFIIEGKTDRTNAWLKKKDQVLFQNDKDLFNEECWDEVFEPLLLDISKIVKYGIPAFGDAFNMAIVKRDDTHSASSPYQVRYFGLDFSKKSNHHPRPLEMRMNLPSETVYTEVSALLSQYLERVMEMEWKRHPIDKDYSELKDFLVRKYTASVSANVLKN